MEAIMSDKDSGHMLLELQEARAEIDRLRELLRWRNADKENPNESGWYTVTFKGLPIPEYYHIEEGWYGPLRYWRPIGPMPGGE